MNQKGMEMAIQVILVLFISFAVGIMILMFSQQLLQQAEDQLVISNAENSPNETFLEIEQISHNQLAGLITSCYNSNNEKVYNNQTCFIVRSGEEFSINQSTLEQLISEEILGEVQTQSLNFFVIKWNFISGKVDVE